VIVDLAVLPRPQQIQQRLGPDQASDMGGEDTLGAALRRENPAFAGYD